MSRLTRRAFVKSAAAGFGAGIVIAGTKASGKVLGANDTVRVAICGIHGRGQSHMDAFGSMKGVEVAYLVDPDKSLFEARSKKIKEKFGNTPKCVQDYRQMLDDPDVDAISVATPNHWHAPLTVFACQAKKDVYVEKPCSHNIFEGRQAVEAARKYGRIVQHGTQSRGSNSWVQMTAAARSGKYGKLLVAKGYCCKPRWSIGFKEVQQPPEYLDFNIWLGPAPQQPFHGNLVHYNWHWFWDFGNGDVGNQGVHQMDLARWAIPGPDGDSATLPKAVLAFGKRVVEGPNHADQGQTPNQQLCVYDYGDHLLVFETRGLVGKHDAFRPKVTDEYYTTDGVIRDGKFYPKGSDKAQSLDVEYSKRSDDVFANFIRCVRDRAPEQLYAPIEVAHYSAALCHLGNISYRLGEGNEAGIGKVRDAFSGFDHEQVGESISMIDRNIRDVFPDLADVKYQLGPKLAFDAAKEKFVDNDKANKLLTRDYREPFVVPKEV